MIRRVFSFLVREGQIRFRRGVIFVYPNGGRCILYWPQGVFRLFGIANGYFLVFDSASNLARHGLVLARWYVG